MAICPERCGRAFVSNAMARVLYRRWMAELCGLVEMGLGVVSKVGLIFQSARVCVLATFVLFLYIREERPYSFIGSTFRTALFSEDVESRSYRCRDVSIELNSFL